MSFQGSLELCLENFVCLHRSSLLSNSQVHGKIIEIEGCRKIVGDFIYDSVEKDFKSNDHDDFPEIHLIYFDINKKIVFLEESSFDRVLILVGLNKEEVISSDILKINKNSKGYFSLDELYINKEISFENKLSFSFEDSLNFIKNLYLKNNLEYNGETYFYRISSKAFKKGNAISLSGYKGIIYDNRPVFLFLTEYVQKTNFKEILNSQIITLSEYDFSFLLRNLDINYLDYLENKLKSIYSLKKEKYKVDQLKGNERKKVMSRVGRETSSFRKKNTLYNEMRNLGILRLNHKCNSSNCRMQMTINKKEFFKFKKLSFNSGNLLNISNILNSTSRKLK